MTDEPNNGAFYIKAEDVNSTDSFTVPGDRTGFSPKIEKNPPQPSYSSDNRQRRHGKSYYVHIYNGWDVRVNPVLYGSSYEDSEMRKPVLEQNNSKIETGKSLVFESDTGHSYLEIKIRELVEPPTEGKLEIVFQDRFR